MQPILARLREPSSWAGIAALAGVFGLKLAPDQMQAIIALLSALAAALAVFLPERK